MNKIIVIGNLTRDPEMRDAEGKSCCNFTVAVNRRVRSDAHPQADYFRVTAWERTAEICRQYLRKGQKVYVEGPVRAHAYIDNQGQPRASLEVTAREVEFLGTRPQTAEEAPEAGGEMTEVADEDFPF